MMRHCTAILIVGFFACGSLQAADPESDAVVALLAKAKANRALARKWFGEDHLRRFPAEGGYAELSVVFPLLRPGLKKADALALVGKPNGDNCYHMRMYTGQLVFRNGRLVDDLRGLYARAGSRYHEINKVRALQRLAELQPLDGLEKLLDGQDQGIDTARALGLLRNRKAIPILAAVARKAAILVPGSESATIHGIYQSTLAGTLGKLTGLDLSMGEQQDPERLERVAQRAEEWWEKNKAKVLRLPGGKWGEESEGLRLKLEADRTCRLGENVAVTVWLSNVSKKPITVCKHPAFFSRYLTGPGGAEVPSARELLGRDPRLPTKRDLFVLRPGKEVEVRLGTFDTVIEDGSIPTDWKATVGLNQSGRYLLRVHYVGVPNFGATDLNPCQAVVLTSNAVSVECEDPCSGSD